jgi:hypothetical protein
MFDSRMFGIDFSHICSLAEVLIRRVEIRIYDAWHKHGVL